MSPKWKIAAYAVLLILSIWFGRRFYTNYSAATTLPAEPDLIIPAMTSEADSNSVSNNPAGTNAATNVPATTDTNTTATSETNAASEPDTNTATAPTTNDAATPGTTIAMASDTNAPRSKTKVHARPRHADVPPPDVSSARSAMITYLAAFVGAMIGLGLLIAHDVSQFVGAQAVDFLFNDAGEGQRDPEYERAEAEWANGKFLIAIQLMRDFLKKNPRELYAALRIAEIYEKDLKNPLAAALEYEEVLKQKLPSERWGWSAIHLCNLYSKLNQSDKTLALLRRIADEYPKTGAAKKARVRLGLAEPDPDPDEEVASVEAEPDLSDEQPVISIEAHPPELEPRLPSRKAAPSGAEPAPGEPKPGLPPGFRPKK